MTDRFAIAVAQLNPVLGDIPGNLERIRAARAEAAAQGADLLVTGELALSGYPPEDLVLKPAFMADLVAAAEALAAETGDGGPAVVLGTPWMEDPQAGHGALPYNAALVLDQGGILAKRYKHHLPNYRVFDELRVFRRGPAPGPVMCRGVRLGVMICEDMWFADVAETLAETGAELLIVPNGSPFETGKVDERLAHAAARVTETELPLVYVNQTGGQDELVFDGGSFVLSAERELVAQGPFFGEAVWTQVFSRGPAGWQAAPGAAPLDAPPDRLASLYAAIMTGLGDYVRKNGFPGVVIGLSGGIDSALTLALAADALGPEQVRAFMLPSPYTSVESLEDAAAVARAFGVQLDEVAIAPAMQAVEHMLAPIFGDRAADVTEENIQSRLRGLTLMAVSNKFGPMLLTTGNKSEMAVGYATLYGDMCGGFNALKDVYKRDVFALCRWRNATHPVGALGPAGAVIPERIISKPPSAELRPDQKDEDSLPPYDILDDILECLIEQEMAIAEIVARGHPEAEVMRVWRLLDRSEYKRRQAPPGVKLTRRAFGRERRYPITNRYLDSKLTR